MRRTRITGPCNDDRGCSVSFTLYYTPIKGKTNVSRYLEAAGTVFLNSDFRYIEEIIGGNQACLVFEATFNDLYVNGVDFLVWNNQQKLTEIRVFIRPFQALNALRELMAKQL